VNSNAPHGDCWRWCIDGKVEATEYASAAAALAALQNNVASSPQLGQ